MFRSGERIQMTERCTDHTQWNHPQRCFLFFQTELRLLVSAKAHETHPGKNATVPKVRMIALGTGITQDIQHVVSKC